MSGMDSIFPLTYAETKKKRATLICKFLSNITERCLMFDVWLNIKQLSAQGDDNISIFILNGWIIEFAYNVLKDCAHESL